MAKPRKHEATREKALARVVAGEPVAVVAREFGINPTTLSSWKQREGVAEPRKLTKADTPIAGTSAHVRQRQTTETTGLDLADTVKAAIESQAAHLRKAAERLVDLDGDPEQMSAAIALRIRLADSWGALAKTAVAAGLPKITTESSLAGRAANEDALELMRMANALTPHKALEADNGEQG